MWCVACLVSIADVDNVCNDLVMVEGETVEMPGLSSSVEPFDCKYTKGIKKSNCETIFLLLIDDISPTYIHP